MVSHEACIELRDQARLIAGAAAVPENHMDVDRNTDRETAVSALFSAFRVPPFFGLFYRENPPVPPASSDAFFGDISVNRSIYSYLSRASNLKAVSYAEHEISSRLIDGIRVWTGIK